MLKMLLGRMSSADLNPTASGPVRPSRNVLSTEKDGLAVLLDLRRCQYLGLDEVGTVAWRAIEAGADAEAAAARVCEEFDGPAESVVNDMHRFIADLRERRLVVRA